MALLTTLAHDIPSQGPAPGGRTALDVGPADPAAESTKQARAATRGTGKDMYFFTSIEDFPPGIGDLGLTHEDAQGFHDYVKQFATPNGWYRDGSVGQWLYEETYDNYLDDYGFDAARVVYHSGHGSMDANGVFWLPVGNNWGGDVWTSSNDMRLGNELARYLFFSTCFSLRVKGGHTPIRTWSTANLGLRMIFGYETVSVDNGDYGKFFFQEWNKNKSFSQAFLDASWRISTSQEPSVAACGATQAEASSRLTNERYFLPDRASTAWWWWRWYDAARNRSRNLQVPSAPQSARLGPALATDRDIAAWAARFDIAVPSDAARGAGRGMTIGGDSGTRLSLGADGSREVTLAETADSSTPISAEQAVKAAHRAVEQYELATDVDLVLDHVRYDRHAGASADERVDPSVREIAVTFVQVIDGMPVVSPDRGRVSVRIDNERTVTAISDSTRPVRELRDRAAAPPQPDSRKSRSPRIRAAGDPGANGSDASRTGDTATLDDLLDGALQNRLRRIAAGGRVPTSVRPVPGATEVGYAMRDGDAVLVARQEVEIGFGSGLAKRYVLEQPLTD